MFAEIEDLHGVVTKPRDDAPVDKESNDVIAALSDRLTKVEVELANMAREKSNEQTEREDKDGGDNPPSNPDKESEVESE